MRDSSHTNFFHGIETNRTLRHTEASVNKLLFIVITAVISIKGLVLEVLNVFIAVSTVSQNNLRYHSLWLL